MKKITAMMLCLILALSCAAGLAETAEKVNMGTVNVNGAFEAKCILPEGYTIKSIPEENGGLISLIESEDPAKPLMMLSIMFDELFADVKSLNDVDAETLAYIESTFTSEDDVTISYAETKYGTKLMVVKEINDLFVDVYTIYQGYCFEFVMIPSLEGGAETLSDAQIQLMVEFIGNLDFDPIEQ